MEVPTLSTQHRGQQQMTTTLTTTTIPAAITPVKNVIDDATPLVNNAVAHHSPNTYMDDDCNYNPYINNHKIINERDRRHSMESFMSIASDLTESEWEQQQQQKRHERTRRGGGGGHRMETGPLARRRNIRPPSSPYNKNSDSGGGGGGGVVDKVAIDDRSIHRHEFDRVSAGTDGRPRLRAGEIPPHSLDLTGRGTVEHVGIKRLSIRPGGRHARAGPELLRVGHVGEKPLVP